MQKLFDDLTAANAAVAEFLGRTTAPTSGPMRSSQLDRVQARSDAAAGHAERPSRRRPPTRRGAVEAERRGRGRRATASATEGETLQGRLAGLKNSEEYKAQGRIEDKRREVAGRRAPRSRGQRDRLGRDRRELGEAEEAARKLDPPRRRGRADADRYAPALADAAQRSGIADDGFGPVDAGDDLLAGGPGAGRRPPGRRRRDPQAAAGDQGRQRQTRASAEQDLGRPAGRSSKRRNRRPRPRRPASPGPVRRPRTN